MKISNLKINVKRCALLTSVVLFCSGGLQKNYSESYNDSNDIERMNQFRYVVINEENKLEIDFHVIVSYGVSISTVSDNLIENVKYKVQEFTGLEIKKINIFVEGVRVID